MTKPNIKLDRKGIWVVAVVFITLFANYPYIFSRFFPIPEPTYIMAAASFLLIVISVTVAKKKSLPPILIQICTLQVIIFLFMSVYHSDLFYMSRFALFVVFTILSLFVIRNTVGCNNFVKINNFWLTIQVFLGVIGFFLIVTNFLSPLMVCDLGDYRHNYFYGLTTTNAIVGIIPRIAGYFDEPGALAQWGVYAIILNKISPQYSKRVEIILIIGLFVTFSMAYFIQLFLYLMVFNFTKPKKFIPIFMILIVGFFVAQKYISESSDLYYLTFKRFEMTGGQLETNRDYPSEIAKAHFKSSTIFGKGYTNLVDKGVYIFDNPYETLATSGIIGTFALYLPLLVILFKYRKQGAWQAVLVLAVGYLQRPFHIQYIHYLMMYLLFLMCYYNNKSKQIDLKLE